MTITDALQWTEKLAQENYTDEELRLFLEFMHSADSEDVERVLNTYYLHLSELKEHSVKVSPDFIQKLRLLKPEHDYVPAKPESLLRNFNKRRQWIKFAAAAVFLIAIAGVYYVFNQKKPSQSTVTVNHTEDHAPGSNKAILTLADGSKIILDDSKQGNIAQQAGVKIIKIDSGMLGYTSTSSANVEKLPVTFNTITTPRGGQYQVILPDGSHIWLNSASSLRFPTSFPGNNRKVELTGEGYFEIAKNAAKPFVVGTGGTEVTVLGTHFNVMAYANEKVIKTTLLEGSVKVTHGTSNATILPGQQASLPEDADKFIIGTPNLEEVTAWKEGKFRFDEMDIYSIMRQIERWYDVDIEYEGNLSGITLSGAVPRKNYASELLSALEMTQRVRFEIRGSKIIVKPYNK